MKNYQIYSDAIIDISLLKLISAIIIIALVFVLRYLGRRLIKKIKNDEKEALLKNLFSAVLLILGLFGISALFLKNFFTLHLFRTDTLSFDAAYIFYILFIALITFFSIKILEIFLYREVDKENKQTDIKKKGLVLIKYLIWAISISLILKIALKNPSKPANFELIAIQNITITVFDIFLLTIIFSVTGLLLLGIKRYFQYQTESSKIDSGNAAALYKIIKYVVWVLAIIIALQSAGFNISLILAGSAALLVGLGIGVQSIFADIVSGFILLLERPLKATDVVKVDDVVGRVKGIGIRTTTLYTRNDTIIRVPNSKFTTESISNWSDLKYNTRFSVSVGVAYGSDVESVMKTMKQCAVEHEKIDSYPKPFVRFEDFGNSSLNFSVFFWSSENMGIENIKSDIRVAIDREFRKHSITIPFPQRDLHIISQNKGN